MIVRLARRSVALFIVAFFMIATTAVICVLVWHGEQAFQSTASDRKVDQQIDPVLQNRSLEKKHSPDSPKARTREEKVRRIEELFAGLVKETEWAKMKTTELRKAIQAYASMHSQNPEIEELDCRSEYICRLILAYSSPREARTLNQDIPVRKMFSWDGSMISKGMSATRQTLLLLREGWDFDGWNIVKTTPSKTRGSNGQIISN